MNDIYLFVVQNSSVIVIVASKTIFIRDLPSFFNIDIGYSSHIDRTSSHLSHIFTVKMRCKPAPYYPDGDLLHKITQIVYL